MKNLFPNKLNPFKIYKKKVFHYIKTLIKIARTLTPNKKNVD
jgi:hypothetical protein